MNATSWVHRGFEAFAAGSFEDGGSNLYVNAHGIIETIHRTDVDNDGYVDIVLPNAQGYNERGPTWIYKPGPGDGSDWERRELPTDSGDMCRIVDLDGDGYQDLVVVNSTNGVSCELLCHIYWGGPGGLTGARTDLPTVGAYDVAAVDVDGDGRLDLVFPSAWVDHHNPGRPLPLHVYRQCPDRRFEDVGGEYGLTGIGARSVAAADLNGDGHVDLVVANYRHEFEYRIDSYLYWGTEDGFDPTPQGLPTDTATQVFLADFNGDGRPEILFCGNNKVLIYWNDEGRFSPDNRLVVETEGLSGEFHHGDLYATAGDVDGDGRDELIVATIRGIEIRAADDLIEVRQFLPLKFAHWAHVADLDGDGRPELIASKYQEDETFNTRSAIFWNGPDGYSPERCSRVATMGAEGVAAGDLDGDGKPVIVFCNTMTGHAKTSPTLPSYIYFGGPEADYGVHRRQELPVGGECGDCAVADLDLDGWNDLVFGKMTGVRVFPGGPDGFRPERHYDLPCFLPCVQVADFNRDGYLDILALSHTYDDKPETFADSSRIFRGSAEGFSADRYDIFPTFCGATGYLADLTRNGYLDVLVGDKRGYVLIYLGGPEGYSLERTQRIPMWKDWKGGRQYGGRPQRQRLAGPGGVQLRPLPPQARHPDDLLRRSRRLRLARRPGLQGRILARADVRRRPQQQRPAGPDRSRLLDRPDAGRADPDLLEPWGPLRPGAPAGAARRRGIRGAAHRPQPQRLDRPVRGLPPQRRRPRGGLADLLERPGGPLERPHHAAARHGAAPAERAPTRECLYACADRTLHLAAARGRGPATCPDPLACGGARHHGAAVRGAVRGA